MKAAQITRFGGPEVLAINDVETPAPGPGEELVSVGASSVNGHDAIDRKGELKIMTGSRLPIGVGLDFAGVVAATGTGGPEHRVGNRVWGTVHPRKRHSTGGTAEYVVVPADRVGLVPEHLSPGEAASLTVAGVTALARDRHAKALIGLGAEQVLDYGDTAAEEIGPYDVILDTVGAGLRPYRSRLARGGRMVTVGLSPGGLATIALSGVHGSRRIRTFSANPRTTVLDDLDGHVTSGAQRHEVDKVYPPVDVSRLGGGTPVPFLPSLPRDATVLDGMKAYPESSAPLIDYHSVVLRGPSALTVGERELIAAYVSGLNACHYCHGVHSAVAEAFGIEEGVLAGLLADVETAPVRDELKPLFAYVRKLTLTPSWLVLEDADAVLAAGWEERTLFDAISVCALFNFMNRLVE